MISEIRVVAERPSKQEAIDENSLFVATIIALAPEQTGEWECVDDVTSRSSNGYVSRMKLVYRGINRKGGETE